MQAPLPEVPVSTVQSPSKNPNAFLGLDVVCGVLALFLVAGIIRALASTFSTSQNLSFAFYFQFLIASFPFIGVYAFLLYFLWRRRDWARSMVSIGCILGFLWMLTQLSTLLYWPGPAMVARWLTGWCNYLFLFVFLPLWLNLPGVKAQFKPLPKIAQETS